MADMAENKSAYAAAQAKNFIAQGAAASDFSGKAKPVKRAIRSSKTARSIGRR